MRPRDVEKFAATAYSPSSPATVRGEHPDWPGLRVGVNSGLVVSEMDGRGYVAFPAVGDPVNVAARVQAAAPVGGVSWARTPGGSYRATSPWYRCRTCA